MKKFRKWSSRTIFMLAILAQAGMAPGAEKNYSLEAETGLGFDSNAFLTPKDSFFDPFLNAVVQPERKSGFFIPLAVKGDHALGPEDRRLLTSLKATGRFYPAGNLDNAENYWTKLGTGLELLLGKKGARRNTFFIGPYVAYNKEVYFDRDTGQERATTGTAESLANRFSYWRYGLTAKFQVRTTPVRFAINADINENDYEEVPLLDSLDHLYYRAGGEVEYDIFPTTELNVNYSYYARDWDSRRTRDLQGNLVNGTIRKYTYSAAGVTVRQTVQKGWFVYFDYDQIWRDDEFVGYNDYTYRRYRVRSRYRFDRGPLLRAEVAYWTRDYPRAFAFDNPAFPHKDYQTWEGEARLEIPLAKAWKLWSEYQFLDQDSADPRYNYQRHLLAVGLNLEL